MVANTVANSPDLEHKKETASANDLVILDIGKHDTDAIKKLRKGKGGLLRKVNNAVEQLREAGSINKDAQIVLVIAREKNAGLLDILD